MSYPKTLTPPVQLLRSTPALSPLSNSPETMHLSSTSSVKIPPPVPTQFSPPGYGLGVGVTVALTGTIAVALALVFLTVYLRHKKKKTLVGNTETATFHTTNAGVSVSSNNTDEVLQDYILPSSVSYSYPMLTTTFANDASGFVTETKMTSNIAYNSPKDELKTSRNVAYRPTNNNNCSRN